MRIAGEPSAAGPVLLPSSSARLLAVLLIVGLTAMSAYAGCRQLHEDQADAAAPDRIEAVEAIHDYIDRVEEALRAIEDPSADGPGG